MNYIKLSEYAKSLKAKIWEIVLMSKIEDYINERSKRDSEFAKLSAQEDINLKVSVQIMNLRDSLNLSQREFAELVGKPQSTIARLENATFNASTRLLAEIAANANAKLSVS